MLLEKVDTHVGRAIVASHRHDRDARRILIQLRQDATISAAGRLRVQEDHSRIVTTRLDSSYKGTQTQFLAEFQTRLDRYNDACSTVPEMKITDPQAKIYLRTAVDPAPNLRAVTVRETEDVSIRNAPPYNYSTLMQVLFVAAQTHDHRPRRATKAHVASLESEITMTDSEDTGEPTSLNVYAADSKRPMLPSSVYSSLSKEGKTQWRSGFSNTDKETILAGMIQANQHSLRANVHFRTDNDTKPEMPILLTHVVCLLIPSPRMPPTARPMQLDRMHPHPPHPLLIARSALFVSLMLPKTTGTTVPMTTTIGTLAWIFNWAIVLHFGTIDAPLLPKEA